MGMGMGELEDHGNEMIINIMELQGMGMGGFQNPRTGMGGMGMGVGEGELDTFHFVGDHIIGGNNNEIDDEI